MPYLNQGGTDYAHLISIGTPGFSDLPTGPAHYYVPPSPRIFKPEAGPDYSNDEVLKAHMYLLFQLAFCLIQS